MHQRSMAVVSRGVLALLAALCVALIASSSAQAVATDCGSPVDNGTTSTVTCSEYGGPQSFTVPANVDEVTIDAEGASGGNSFGGSGGSGGDESGQVAVTQGETFTVLVGGKGDSGGYAGGGPGSSGANAGGGAGGGGSFVFDSSDNLIIAAGGGGGAGGTTCTGGDAGNGGGDVGTQASCTGAGGGGTQSNGGAAGDGSTGSVQGQGPASSTGGTPSPGQGGGGTTPGPGGNGPYGGGGGGGGYYGGGGGLGMGGGGGSGFHSASVTNASQTTGANSNSDGQVTFTYATPTAPTITSASSSTFTHGHNGTFTATTSGAPTPTITKTGSLPSGVMFHDNGDGTATISGTPTGGSGAYPITITASNGVGSDATQNFTLYVSAPCPAPSLSGGHWVVTCSYTGGPQTFTVPQGFSSVSLDVKGGQGGSDNTGNTGGEGGEISGSIPVTAGEQLVVVAGGAGQAASTTTGGTGGYGGGGTGGSGPGDETDIPYGGAGGGGGGSFVYKQGGPVLAAAGGGGGGSENGRDGAAGGGHDGGDPSVCDGTATGATQSAPGAAGVGASAATGPAAWSTGAPVFGRGGDGGSDQWGGGGGGGGYYGGGGGDYSTSPPNSGIVGNCGGGGGSGNMPGATSLGLVGTVSGNGSVTISYTPAPPTASIASPSDGQSYAQGQSVPTQFSCSDSATGPGISSCKDSNGSSSPGHLNTSSPGVHSYTVTAVSQDGQQSSQTITYTVLARHRLSLAKSGTGSGTVTSSPAGINCGSTCSATYGDGATVTLTAHPAKGSTFAGWSGGGCSSKSTCQVQMTSDQAVTATFKLLPPKCSMLAASSKVHTKGKKRGKLSVGVACNQAVKAKLGGTLKVGKKSYKLGPAKAASGRAAKRRSRSSCPRKRSRH